MKTRTILSALLLLALLLSACQSAAPTPQAPVTEPAGANPTPGDYPEPQDGADASPAGYPAPQEKSVQAPASTTVLYPDPQSGDEVSWDQAYAMMRNGEVTEILKSSTGMLTLTLKDGRALVVKEPKAGDLEIALKSCGAVCESIKTQPQ